jgi:hypothetical protein
MASVRLAHGLGQGLMDAMPLIAQLLVLAMSMPLLLFLAYVLGG